jgi:DNA-binding transcriptional ArsR family regulator
MTGRRVPGRAPVRTRARLVPDEDIRPGAVIGGWRVIRERRYQSTRGVQLACATCGHERVSRRQVLAALAVRRCPHPAPAPWSAERYPGQARVLDWLREHAPGRPARAAEIGAALGLTADSVRVSLRALADAGLAVLLSRQAGLWALPGVTAETSVSWAAARITAFLAADGGGIFSEVQAAAGLPPGHLSRCLAHLIAKGEVVRLEDTRGGFYLLPGQEPGQVIAWAGEECASAGRVSDRSRLRQRRTCGTAYPRRLFTGG